MNFIQLVQRTQSEAGILNRPITSIAAAATMSPLHKNLVSWVAEAWQSIQTERDWTFRQAVVSTTLPALSNELDLATIGASAVRKIWSNGSELRKLTRSGFLMHAVGSSADRPSAWAPDVRYGFISFNQKSKQETPLILDIVTAVQKLVNDTDEPLLREDLHMRIVWRALESYGTSESMESIAAMAVKKDQALRRIMISQCAEPLQVQGTPFA